MRLFLIDYENVNAAGLHGIGQVSRNDLVILFYSHAANTLSFEIMDEMLEAGIMPVTNRAQIERMVSRCGVMLPEKYKVMLEKYGGNDDAIMDAGIAYAINQIIDLVSHGVDGIHLYTMNKPQIARRIHDAVKNILAIPRDCPAKAS